MGINKSWENDWETFIYNIFNCYKSGTDDLSLSKKLQGKKVIWKGILARSEINREYAACVEMKMKAIKINLGINGNFIADNIILFVEKDNLQWRHVKIGDVVKFSATISTLERSPFLPVRIKYYKGGKLVVPSVNFRNAEVINN